MAVLHPVISKELYLCGLQLKSFGFGLAFLVPRGFGLHGYTALPTKRARFGGLGAGVLM